MYKAIIVLAMAFLLFNNNVAYATKFAPEAQNGYVEIVEENTYDVAPEFWIYSDDSVEVTYNKIVAVMKTLKPDYFYEILIASYPEEKWDPLLKRLADSKKFELEIVTYEVCGEKEEYIRIRNK